MPSHSLYSTGAMIADTDWSLARRIAFRFACLYWLFFLTPYLLAFIGDWKPFGPVAHAVGLFMAGLVSAMATHLLRLPPHAALPHPTGSGDTMFDYVQALTIALLAAVGTVLWSLFDRDRRAYPALQRWLYVIVRYGLALALLSYGVAKILPMQY